MVAPLLYVDFVAGNRPPRVFLLLACVDGFLFLLGLDYFYMLLFCRFSAWLLLVEEAQGLGKNVCELLSNILFLVYHFSVDLLHAYSFYLFLLFAFRNVMQIT